MKKNLKWIQFSESHEVAEVRMNRPDVRNAFNPEMIEELTQAFKAVARRKDLRALVLSGQGKSFCAGADLNWMQEMVKYSLAKNKKDSEKIFDLFQSLMDCSLPVIGLVQGAAFGGALGLVACCDLVVMDEKTQLCFSEVKLGIAPAVISHFVLKKSNLGHVAPWMMSGKVFGAQEAQRMGLAHDVVPESEMTNCLQNALNQFGEAGPEAVRETKRLIQKVSSHSKAKARVETTKLISKLRVSSEGQEGLGAFLGKRIPEFKSRWRSR